ncbi:xanthine and CO dehydrogenases maturation factor, XdhC/CoxF family [Shewanella psychrophila]|uniref:Xanthine and CO dehydrogenases maturation factor, XdhC/CoxF family n=1 Tax=Shewanella psychrophila TaxID=225848 RepID=A0A1S6HMZ4_9GAMM|nr:XdhC family protein [Shewanella psychrophila]AQS36879.1 xanthine and CO dehydrogenases maturation factor, XdhC/CoxF family [Shewanella psychrophila]
MSYHIEDILSHWQSAPNDDWVLAIITHVQGSSYRKPGAMMLFHPLGRAIGILSGGCLEGDLRRHAQMAIQERQAMLVQYDASDETDVSYHLGCGGIVDLMLVPLSRDNHYLHFHQLAEQLHKGEPFFYQLTLPRRGTELANVSAKIVEYCDAEFSIDDFKRTGILHTDRSELVVPMRPRFRIAIFGGGLDAQPMVSMALNLGWQIDLIDERASYARNYDFPGAKIFKHTIDDLPDNFAESLDGIIIMQHNLDLDANALSYACQISDKIKYTALLGPAHRRDKVLEKAGLNLADFNCLFAAPAGIALGGELPESVALSILSQCHGVFHEAEQIALDKVML